MPPNRSKAKSAELARALFAPRGVALIGASDDPEKPSARPLRFLKKHGFSGGIYPVNPVRERVGGEPALAEISAAGGPVDLAYILVGAARVEAAVEQCAAAGIPAAAVLADGFADAGKEGAARQSRLIETARRAGVRLLGPNSLGIVVPARGLAVSGNAALEAEALPVGRLGFISQSGSLLGTLLSRGAARGLGFSKMVSVGNEADLSVAELGEMLVDDPETDAILLFLETIRDGAAVARFARRAFAAGKPVVAYLLGRSEPGRAAALSHTGAIVGSDAAADAFFRAHGIIRVDHLETLLEIAPLARAARVGGTARAVAVISTTGGGGAMVADRLGLEGVEVAGFDAEGAKTLNAQGVPVKPGRIIDVTLAGTRPEIMRTAIDAALAMDEVAMAVAVIGSSAQFRPELAAEAVAAYADSKKPVAAFVVPDAPETLARLATAGLAAFRTPESCAEAVRAVLAREAPRKGPPARAPRAAADLLKGAKGPVLDALDSLKLFLELTIPAIDLMELSTIVDKPVLPFDFPVAVKALAAELAHKTEAGGVILDVRDAAALAAAIAEIGGNMSRHLGADGPHRLLVQPMVDGLGEVLLGFNREPGIGPVVTLGAGGVLSEIYRDVAVRPAPVDAAEASAMIGEVEGLAPLRGYRNMARGDLDALAAAVAAFSQLAALPVAEAEINPLIVRADGVVAVDGLVRLSPAPPA